MSFHIKQIDNEKIINYNYYNQYAKRESDFQFIYKGRENTPNLIITEGSHNVSYTSTKFTIFSKIHKINGVNFDGELVIENTPITNSNKKLYVSFPLKTVSELPSENIIDFIIQQTSPNSNIELNLNDVLPNQSNCIYYDSINHEVLLFTTPIHVKSNFHNISNKNSIFSENDNYQIFQGKLIGDNANHIEGLHENKVYSTYKDVDVKPELQKKIEQWHKTFKHVLSSLFSGKIFDNFDVGSPERKKNRDLQKILKKVRKSKTPDTWNIKSHLENFVEGMTMEDNGDEWMECDNVPIDYSGEIPTYTVNASSKTTDQNSNYLLKTLQIFWILFTVVLLYVMVPLMYGFLAVRSIIKINSADVTERHGQITGLEMALSFLIVFPSIVLLLYSFNNSKMGSDGNWTFNSQTIINCVVSGGILMFFWILSCVIIYIKKIQDPNFLGYENGNLRTPYFTFGAKTDLNNGLKHIFTSIVALFK